MTPGVVCLHIGTHKTGTKTLQSFLAGNRQRLMQSGVYVPLAGRHKISEHASPVGSGSSVVHTMFTPGQHVLAWELRAGEQSEALGGLVAEIGKADARCAVVSSEELHPLYRRPHALATVRDAFGATGIAVFVIVYLRRQDHYAESLYGEYVKAGYARPFEEYLELILREGTFVPHEGAAPIEFQYTRLIAPFADVFGTHSLVVRPYHSSAQADALPRDFLSVLAAITGPLAVEGLKNPQPRANESQTFRQLLECVRVALPGGAAASMSDFLTRHAAGVEPEVLDGRFRLLRRSEASLMMRRFGEDNALLEQLSGCIVPLRSQADLAPAADPLWATAAVHRGLLGQAFAEWGPAVPA